MQDSAITVSNGRTITTQEHNRACYVKFVKAVIQLMQIIYEWRTGEQPPKPGEILRS